MEFKKLSILIPVYNEERFVCDLLEKVIKCQLDYDLEKEIIIVDDGSIDGTVKAIEDFLRKKDNPLTIKFIKNPKNEGKGSALRKALKEFNGDIVIFQDADLEYDPLEYNELIKPIISGFGDVVYGSRLMGGRPQRAYMFWHKIGNNFLTFLTNLLYNTTISDMETGYKVFRRQVIKNLTLKSNGFSIEPEVTAKILKNSSNRIYEIPISYYGRTYKEGKKITWRQGFSAMLTLFWYRFFD